MLTHNYDYRSTFEASNRTTWQLEDVIDGRSLDFTLPFLPESFAGVDGIGCLEADEKLKLNQIRGLTYLRVFGLVEEYILPSVVEHAGATAYRDEHEMRALLRFADDEAKHILLFKRFVEDFNRGFGSACGFIGPAKDIAAGILNHSRLGVFLATLHIEWMTQRHYVESVKGKAEGLDPLFVSLLRHHWLDEAQHAKLDTLIIDQIAGELDPHKIEVGIDDYMDIGKMLDQGLAAQVKLDLESLERAIGRTLSMRDREEIGRAQLKAYRWTFLLSGMTHPSFERSLRELSAAGHQRVAELARAIS